MKKLYAIVAMVLAFALQSFPVMAEPVYTKQAIERWIVKETKAQVNTATVNRIINAAFNQAKKHGPLCRHFFFVEMQIFSTTYT